ncbi:damage-inducible protein DinB [Hwanghaeella grinnelliae]|uniref:Damage-inducible protein DinB n=1 Tax=Hwanghaeella grinnelliae TaxID=2500179 RepID=A0A437QJK8_9PROT|nr:DinB family protein [Hwanghaeella grinnelliae]RVU34691.1 damage-inducible protein DinB [Hwanghaeella grinnelliae]
MSIAVRQMVLQARNNRWANNRLLSSCGELPESELTKQRLSFFGTILAALNHILVVDWYYIDAMREAGKAAEIRDKFRDGAPDPFADMAALIVAQAQSDADLIAFCEELSETDLSRQVDTLREGGVIWRESIGDLLLHLFQHQIHHRGQVHDMLSATPVAPPQLDEFYLAMDRAGRGE